MQAHRLGKHTFFTTDGEKVQFQSYDADGSGFALSFRDRDDNLPLAWLYAFDSDTCSELLTVLVLPSELRRLANVLAPLADKPHATDRFCHTCGAKTVENKPVNNAPTFLAKGK